MAYTPTDLARVEKAIASATLEVEFNGRRVKYRSTEELLAVRAEIMKSLQSANPTSRMVRIRHAGKGV